jgi:Domain of unknown function (DUF3516)/DEAD/DEAH box helicase
VTLPADPPGGPPADPDEIFQRFTDWAAGQGLTLYPHQEDALLHLVTGDNVVAATPTGSGKSLIGVAALFAARSVGRRGWYTAPIKALVSEKFFEMVAIFGAADVGMITGDSAVNPDAPIICCTAEILAGVALRSGRDAEVGVAVMDEFHYYGDRQRGWAWQVPLLELPQTQFVLMSATLGDVTSIAEDLSARTGRETALLTGVARPVPLHFSYVLTAVPETLEELVASGRTPVYLVHFTQQAAVERAQALLGLGLADRSRRDRIAEVIGDFRFAKGFGRTLSRMVHAGIGVHHAGMLPRYRRLVERLAQAGLLVAISGTDTLGVGINVPIRTVVLTALAKYDGRRSRLLTAREFHQIAGRAGRAGYDTAGDVVVLAPEHVIENAKVLAKAGADPAKQRKVVRRKAPDGAVGWAEATFDRLVAAPPEPLTPHLRITHAIVMNLLARPTDIVASLRSLIEGSHEPRRRQLQLISRALSIGRSLLTSGVVIRLDAPDEYGRRFVIAEGLQLDFALDQPLSPLALAALDLLDPASPEYPLDVLSLIEATLEGPSTVLAAQRHLAKGEAIAAMKADGLEYEERMALLEDVDYPKPLADLVEVAYESYRRGHPWVAEYPPEPKAIARELFQRAMTFTEYIAFYTLARSEGVVLRYLADAYRAMRRTVPLAARTEELLDVISWLGELVRGIDSSLLEEWEALAHPSDDEATAASGIRPPSAARGISENPRALSVMIRNALFRRVELLAHERYQALADLDADAAPDTRNGWDRRDGWDASAWEDAMAGYWAEYDAIGIGSAARSGALVLIQPGPDEWRIRQILDDPAGDHDWGIEAVLDVAATDEAGEPVLHITGVGPVEYLVG